MVAPQFKLSFAQMQMNILWKSIMLVACSCNIYDLTIMVLITLMKFTSLQNDVPWFFHSLYVTVGICFANAT
jgi:hypothetical protein